MKDQSLTKSSNISKPVALEDTVRGAMRHIEQSSPTHEKGLIINQRNYWDKQYLPLVTLDPLWNLRDEVLPTKMKDNVSCKK